MSYEDVKVARDGSIGIVTIDRPKVNALRAQTMDELGRALGDLQADATVRTIIITGGGDRAFSGGADLASAFRGDAKPGTSADPIEEGLERFHQLLDQLEAGKPVIAAINGFAFGGGCELALACHFRIMDPKAEIGLTETNVGIFPAGGGTQRLPRLVGVGRALDMIVFGKKVSAQEAERIGLATRVSPPGGALAAAIELAREIEKRPPIAVQAAIEAIHAGIRFGHQMGLASERSGFGRVVKSDDAMEGLQAFFEKRAPSFKGK
ncbi:MAG TPA: enoyl-CoA hydratase-related protein [Planctomycetota bacterium]|nr:enoyl-CoA hydratase-related protein [Planctomycetota bacterium]